MQAEEKEKIRLDICLNNHGQRGDWEEVSIYLNANMDRLKEFKANQTEEERARDAEGQIKIAQDGYSNKRIERAKNYISQLQERLQKTEASSTTAIRQINEDIAERQKIITRFQDHNKKHETELYDKEIDKKIEDLKRLKEKYEESKKTKLPLRMILKKEMMKKEMNGRSDDLRCIAQYYFALSNNDNINLSVNYYRENSISWKTPPWSIIGYTLDKIEMDIGNFFGSAYYGYLMADEANVATLKINESQIDLKAVDEFNKRNNTSISVQEFQNLLNGELKYQILPDEELKIESSERDKKVILELNGNYGMRIAGLSKEAFKVIQESSSESVNKNIKLNKDEVCIIHKDDSHQSIFEAKSTAPIMLALIALHQQGEINLEVREKKKAYRDNRSEKSDYNIGEFIAKAIQHVNNDTPNSINISKEAMILATVLNKNARTKFMNLLKGEKVDEQEPRVTLPPKKDNLKYDEFFVYEAAFSSPQNNLDPTNKNN